jgi:asparagine synthetase B (glutamine-hydrolysing)
LSASVCGHTTDTTIGGSLLWIDSGAQPLVNDEGTVSLAVNGEIYNHRILRKSLKKEYNFKTHSDCEVIIPLVWMNKHLEDGIQLT